jgi:hypothetical protein
MVLILSDPLSNSEIHLFGHPLASLLGLANFRRNPFPPRLLIIQNLVPQELFLLIRIVHLRDFGEPLRRRILQQAP